MNKLAQTHILSHSLFQELNVDTRANQKLRIVGESAELIQYYSLRDGTEVAASPLHAFENPDRLIMLFERHKADRIREAFSKVRMQPGFPILMNDSYRYVLELFQHQLLLVQIKKSARLL